MKEELFQHSLQIKYEPKNNVTYDYNSQQLPSERPVYNDQFLFKGISTLQIFFGSCIPYKSHYSCFCLPVYQFIKLNVYLLL